MAHDERRLEVLRAIVQDYVSTNDPVGSKALADRHDLGVSPATIRNDMAVLEEQGYITQPHTSAGRVPTDKGYRLFVDRLSAVKPLSAAERKAIERFLDGAVDLHDVLGRTVRLLAQLTRQVAVVQYPTLSRSAVRHLEVVQVAAVPAHAGAHHRHRPRRAARRRLPGRHRRRRGRRAAHAAELRLQRGAAHRGRRQGARPAGDGAAAPARRWWPRSAPRCWRPSSSPARTGWSSAGRRTSPAATRWTSRAPSARCSRRWRSRSSSSASSARSTPAPCWSASARRTRTRR